MPDKQAAEKVESFAKEQMSKGDSVGGIIECVISGVMPGIGEPVFDKLDANLAKAVMSIGAVKKVLKLAMDLWLQKQQVLPTTMHL